MSNIKLDQTINNNESIVISGIAGAFPKCDNMQEFAEKLFAKEDLITDIESLPKSLGLLNDRSRFDAMFFGIPTDYVNCMEPGIRMLFEKSYEAVLDAGVNPTEMKGKNIGVYIGTSSNDGVFDVFQRLDNVKLAVFGTELCMLANRLSFSLDVKGPSLVINTGCSSGLHALHAACRAIKNGECESALVGACNICTMSDTNLQYINSGVLNLTNFRCRSFGRDANGYVRSEAACVIFIQKRSAARRIYAEVINTRCNQNGFSQNGISCTSGLSQRRLVDDLCAECGVDKNLVSWVESHGPGTKVGDLEELYCFETFCQNRPTPLYVGSVKSNMGHAEGASGLCAIAKVIIAMEHSAIPPNINIEHLNYDLKQLANGSMKIITETLRWDGGIVGVNAVGIGGSNSHVLLKSNEIVKRSQFQFVEDGINRLVVVSGQTKEAVNTILQYVHSIPRNNEFIGLIHGIFRTEIKQHLYRGYTLIGENVPHIEVTSGEKPSLWFIFSGMGSQWASMAKSLMKISIFECAIQKCHDVLQKNNYNLKRTLLNDDPSVYKRLMNSFICITAMQIALTDVLKAMNIVPDGIIGHSMGELAAAYCDGCLTLEECILSSYYRAVCTSECNMKKGLMLSVGLSYDALIKRCPPEVDIACRNSPCSYTLSGPKDTMEKLQSELIADNIFAKLVYTEEVPYHSRYIKEFSPFLLADMEKVIKNPKCFSEKFISSVGILDEDIVNTDLRKYASTDYFVKNLISCVNFEEAVSRIPDNAVTLEVSSHPILTPVFKHFKDKRFCSNLSLMNRNQPDNYLYFLNALGKLYNNGISMNLEAIYPPVEYPVRKGTPMISPLIRWNHSVKWPVTCFQKGKPFIIADRWFNITLDSDQYRFLKDHVVDGRNVFPACGYLVLAWRSYAAMYSKDFKEMSVSFRNVYFKRILNLSKDDGVIPLNVTIHRGTGYFEFSESQETLCTGYIRAINKEQDEDNYFIRPSEQSVTINNENQILKVDDIYREISLRGLKFGPEFQNIVSANLEGTENYVKWNGNWITFLDLILQCYILQMMDRRLQVPERIEQLTIDVEAHTRIIKDRSSSDHKIPVNVTSKRKLIISPSVVVKNLMVSPLYRRQLHKEPVLKKMTFFPYTIQSQKVPLHTVMHMMVNVVMENLLTNKLKIVEFVTDYDRKFGKLPLSLVADEISETHLWKLNADVYVTGDDDYTIEPQPSENVNVHSVENFANFGSDLKAMVTAVSYVSHKTLMLEKAFDVTQDNGFIILRESSTFEMSATPHLHICCDYATNDGHRLLLLRKVIRKYEETAFFRMETDNNYEWVTDLQRFMKTNAEKRIVLLAEHQPLSGILGFYKCLRQEKNAHNVRCVFVMDETMTGSPEEKESLYEEQLRKDLSVNVYKDGHWGCYQSLPLEGEIKIPAPYSYLSIKTTGRLDTMTWLRGCLPSNESDENIIHVYYAALNFKDVLLATGLLATERSTTMPPGRSFLGIEYSGKLANGRRVFGMVYDTGIATLLSDPKRVYFLEVPDNWNLEDAATVSCAYGTVLYGLIYKCRLKEGESILIGSGAGAVGLAAINVALYYKCVVYTTVSNESKKSFLKETFPSLEDSHIIIYGSESVQQIIIEKTDGNGVDIVLNSYSGLMRDEYVRCVKQDGRFIELGKPKVSENGFGLSNFPYQVSYHNVIVTAPIGSEQMKIMFDLLRIGIEDGVVKPLKRTVFMMDEAEQAFRYMSAGHHMGKVLIRIRPEEEKPEVIMKESVPQLLCKDESSVVICGGLGAMGLELCDWLISRGVKNLVLTSRYGLRTGYQKLCMHRWKTVGANVVISLADVVTESGVEDMIRTAGRLGNVLGIFNLTMVLRNEEFLNQTPDNFRTTADSKAIGTALLDSVSRRLCPSLRYFVVFSSVSCGYGFAGQTNYGLANSVMERICEIRKRDGLNAVAIEWGVVADVGIFENMPENINMRGYSPQPIRSCLSLLDRFLHQSDTIVVSFMKSDQETSQDTTVTVDNVICNALGIKELTGINRRMKLSEFGLDSITKVEIKQMLEYKCNIYFTSKEIDDLTIADVLDMSKL